MLGPPLPPSSSHLPPPSPPFSCSEWAPPLLLILIHSPSLRLPPGMTGAQHVTFQWGICCQKNCNFCRCSNSILHPPPPHPCLVSYTHCFSGERGGPLRSLYLALIPICALKRQTVFPQTTTPPPLPFAPLSQEATRLSVVSHATRYVVEMLSLFSILGLPVPNL